MPTCFRNETAVADESGCRGRTGLGLDAAPKQAGQHRGRDRCAVMPLRTSFAVASDNFAELFRQVVENGEVVVIHRRGHEDAALVCMAELGQLLEAAYRLPRPTDTDGW